MPSRASHDVVITADSSARQPRTSQVPAITGLRLSPYGAAATLVNISASGVLAECTLRLKVDSAVKVVFEGEFSLKSAEGRVMRCEVAAMGRDGLIRYQIGIAFTEPIPFDAPASPPASVEAARGSQVPTAHASLAPTAVRNQW